jgi:hypothetical protein
MQMQTITPEDEPIQVTMKFTGGGSSNAFQDE